MSEKKELRWENPATIYVPGFLNNRELNPVYVESLEDSMQKDGFLPTFPIVCFRRLDMQFFDDYTSELYICAAGAHRTTAAQNLGLEKVYIDLRTGTMDDFIEAMHTDNFQFDPALDTSLGQLFTKTEKREACKQLLLIPKYLKLTNVALADMWHTSEGNIRRWRDEVASLINDASDGVIFQHLPEGRLAEIQDILNSNMRENSDGSVVQVRSKPQTDKWDYYWGIQEKVKEMPDLDWNLDVRSYCLKIYEQEPGDLSMKKLSELDRRLSARDKDFLEKCRFFGDARRRLEAARDTYNKAFRDCEEAFVTYMKGMGENLSTGYRSDEYKACLKSFGRAVSRNFGKHLLGSKLYTDTVAKYERETTQVNTLKSDIEKSVEYVQKFAERYRKRRLKKRETLETELVTAQHEMLTAAKKKYPDLDLTKFALAVDSDSYWLDMGTTPAFPMEVSHIPEGKKDSDLKYIRDHYIEMRNQVEAGEAWIERLMIAKVQLDSESPEVNRPATPESEPETTEALPPLEPLSAWGAWRAQNYSGYFKLKQYLLDNYSREDGYKKEYQRLHASISQNCHISAVEACLREIAFEKSCERKACNWSRVLDASDVMRAELDKIEWTDTERAKIEKVSDEVTATIRPYQLTRETRLAILGKVMGNLMKKLDDTADLVSDEVPEAQK